ncbi:hypothetical protein Cs7R123_31260 [Catellatospora sp. TT07R-123]|uniref:hypothetical protein n=1 Tax=Catellatospora sp. TT07R-123 TaxID=2733863 RepID=UPI001B0658B6|nr:hypothetical protein [Catellatospora sp. TT07R-123]GHJ45784.1 hypothetical protein Cs7R123_31260 [Catellatospora sp. TT07R-123]
MSYKIEVVRTLAEVPDKGSAGRLRISGLSLVVYYFHRIETPIRFDLPAQDKDRGELSYSSKLLPGSGFSYETVRSAGPASAALTEILPHASECDVVHSILTFGGSYLVSAVPYVISVARDQEFGYIRIDEALDVDDCLKIIRAIKSDDEVGARASCLKESLVGDGYAKTTSAVDTQCVDGVMGIQIWDITGTGGREPEGRFRGIDETREYCWELSAILEHSSDHVINDGLWRERSPELVFGAIRHGFSFFDDHMVLVNETCCMEVAHIPAWLRGRSLYRMANFGYDSSSIFVASACILRSAYLRHLSQELRISLDSLLVDTALTMNELHSLTRTEVLHSAVLGRMREFTSSLREPRNRSFSDHMAGLLELGRLDTSVSRDLDRIRAVAGSLAQAREQDERGRTGIILALVAAALAVVGIPGLVDLVSKWVAASDWWSVGISSALVGGCLVGLGFAWRR